MTSLEFRSRKIRRNGVLCKIEFLDAAKNVLLFQLEVKVTNIGYRLRWILSLRARGDAVWLASMRH